MFPGAAADIFGSSAEDPTTVVLKFLYQFGLLLLMFLAGTEVRGVLGRENRRPTAWIVGLGTTLRFLPALAVASWIPLGALIGDAQSGPALMLVIASATAVMSVPVITRIFHDLGILRTRFASLMIGIGVLEDILLWGTLAVAVAIADSSSDTDQVMRSVVTHILANAVFVVAAIWIAPAVLRRLSRSSWNLVAAESPVAWVFAVMLGFVALAAAFDVTLAFAAFLTGFAIVGGGAATDRALFHPALDSISRVSVGVFIPLYFALVGYQLDVVTTFSPTMLAVFLVASSVAVAASVSLAARFAGFRGLSIVHVAVTCNARGGPGIVMAGLAFENGIINATVFTTLVLTAVLTSQICGSWLRLVLCKGWPLLHDTNDIDETAPQTSPIPTDASRPSRALR